jgi:predicted permease
MGPHIPYWHDARMALRALKRDKGFTATALLTFGLCIGANVALFAVVNAVLISPLPYPNPGQLVTVFNRYPKAGVDRSGVSVPHYLERGAGVAAFVEAGAFRPSGATIGESGAPEHVSALQVTPSFLRTLGITPALGRNFADEEGFYGKNNVVIISDGLWRQNYNGAKDVVGRKLRLGTEPQTIIGVMAPRFAFGTERPQLIFPLCFSDDDKKPERRHSNNMGMIARLRPRASIAQAQAQVDAVNASALVADPYAKIVVDAGFSTKVVDLHQDFVTEARPGLLLLQAGVAFLLLIGAVNLANLLLVRASARHKEFSVRQVLGAGRGQIARLLLAETLVLALAGCALGLAIGWAGLRGLEALGADDLPHFVPYGLDTRVCMAALGLSVLTGLLLAVPMIWHSLRGNLAQALSVESRGGTTSRATHRLRHALITAQFALAFTLLCGAGLLGLSFARILAVNPGFRPENVLTGGVSAPYARYKEEKQRLALVRRLGAELRAIPGVSAVGFSTNLAFTNNLSDDAISIEGQPPAPGESLHTHYMSGVDGDFFTALGVPLREGRLLTDADSDHSRRVCVVDEDMARRYWPGKSAVGRRIFNGAPGKPEEAYTIVGVVGAAKQTNLEDQKATGCVYFPFMDYAGQHITAVLRTAQAPEAAGTAFRAAVLRVDPELPLEDMKPMSAWIDESLKGRRSPMMLAGIFAGVALVLAAIGIYGVLAYAVAQRRREIGVRMALGALPQQIRMQFLSIGVRLVLVGSALGAVGGWLTGRAMQGLLFGVGAAQPSVFVATAAVLASVAMAACLLPAVRAARVPPMEALRSE